MKIKLLTDTAKIPTRGTEHSAGYDIYADGIGDGHYTQERVYRKATASISTGIAVQIPPGYVGLIQPRSGLAFKHSIDTMAGVIDSDYTGEIKVLLTRHSDALPSYHGIKQGDRIAQLIVVPCYMAELELVDSLEDTGRGDNGFGSTGEN